MTLGRIVDVGVDASLEDVLWGDGVSVDRGPRPGPPTLKLSGSEWGSSKSLDRWMSRKAGM